MSKRKLVTKNSGDKEAFSKEKLKKSLMHTCLAPSECDAVANEVHRNVLASSTSSEIFKKAHTIVRKKSKLAAFEYSIKRSLFDLGPEGHNFESYVARYFNEKKYKTKECMIIQGLAVKHEIDVVATRGNERLFVECKFHNKMGIKNDVKVALYVKARWDDLKLGAQGKKLTGFFLATNTTFSLDAISYAEKYKLNLLGVNAPEGKSFLDEIREMQLYPVTSLTTLNRDLKKEILSNKIFLAKDLLENMELLKDLGCSERKLGKICEEICFLKK